MWVKKQQLELDMEPLTGLKLERIWQGCVLSCYLSNFYAEYSFPHGSAGKEPTCNAGDLGSTPGLGRSPGEGNNYPLQYSGLENSMGSQRVRHDWGTFTYAEDIMWNARLEELQAGTKIAGRNINNLRYIDATTLRAESEEKLKSLLIKIEEESKLA